MESSNSTLNKREISFLQWRCRKHHPAHPIVGDHIVVDHPNSLYHNDRASMSRRTSHGNGLTSRCHKSVIPTRFGKSSASSSTERKVWKGVRFGWRPVGQRNLLGVFGTRSSDIVGTLVKETDGSCIREYVITLDTDATLSSSENRRVPTTSKVAGLALFLPDGFPSSVTDDYLPYMQWSFPCHVFGWMYTSLTTASMLQAVGVSTDPAGVVAVSAALKWVTKDGLGAIGRLIIGGGFGALFDESPRRWRMFAEVFTVFGSFLELSTPMAPSNFLLLASLGNLSKAVGKGLAKPSFRVIQNHFARNGNIGDVAAREEVWEVAAQLTGLLCSVGLLENADVVTSYTGIVLLWSLLIGMHVAARYKSLSVISFDHLNGARLVIVASRFVQGDLRLNVDEVNRSEGVWFPSDSRACCELDFGSSFETLAKVLLENGVSLPRHLLLFEKERFVLVRSEEVYHVVLDESSTSLDLVRATLMAAWMFHRFERPQSRGEDAYSSALRYLEAEFDTFVSQLSESGWDVGKTHVRTGPHRSIRSKGSHDSEGTERARDEAYD